MLVIDNLKEVRSCIWDAQVKWFGLGVELGLHPPFLEAIRTKFSNDPEECFSKMLMDWLAGQGLEATWRNLCSALKAKPVNHPAIAKIIEEKYLKTSHPSGIVMTLVLVMQAIEILQLHADEKLTRGEEHQALRNMGVPYGEQTSNLLGKIAEHEDDEEAAKNSESGILIDSYRMRIIISM